MRFLIAVDQRFPFYFANENFTRALAKSAFQRALKSPREYKQSSARLPDGVSAHLTDGALL